MTTGYSTHRQERVATPKISPVEEITESSTLTPFQTHVSVVVPAAAETLTLKLPAPVSAVGAVVLVKVDNSATGSGNVTIVAEDGSSILGTDGAADTFTSLSTDLTWWLFENVHGQFWLHRASKAS